MYEMGQTMEEVSEGWIEVMATNGNKSKDLNSEKKLLRVQSSKIVVVMCAH